LLLVADVGEFPVEFFDGLDVFGLGWFEADVGFVRHFVAFGLKAHNAGPSGRLCAQGFEAIEILDGAAVFAFGLGAVTERETNRI
jgi:hypothetical protein